jgi:hypothetical protein
MIGHESAAFIHSGGLASAIRTSHYSDTADVMEPVSIHAQRVVIRAV